MRHNSDSFARLMGGAVKLASPEAAVDTYSGTGHVTLGGQVFRFEVREVTPEEAAAEAAGWPEGTGVRGGTGSTTSIHFGPGAAGWFGGLRGAGGSGGGGRVEVHNHGLDWPCPPSCPGYAAKEA